MTFFFLMVQLSFTGTLCNVYNMLETVVFTNISALLHIQFDANGIVVIVGDQSLNLAQG